MAFTLQTIKDRLERRLKDTNNVSNDLLYDWATDLNQFLYREMFTADPERYITTQSYTVTTSPSTQALPASFRDVSEYGTGFFIQNQDGTASDVELAYTGYGSDLVGYYINGTNVVFTGINSSQTIILRYIPTISDIDALSDSFVVPDDSKDLVTEGMVVQYYKWCEDPRESISDQRYARLLSEFLERLPKNPRVYSLPNMTPYF